jgi:uncharacterized membrane protein YeaQ/YmgE (transglycosylase-associated protein family)
MWMTRRDGWLRRRAFGMVDRLGSATAGRRVAEWEEVSMSNESILVILLVGLIAGWLAGQIVKGTGYGLIADICIGIIGALIGSWLLPQLGNQPLHGAPQRSKKPCNYRRSALYLSTTVHRAPPRFGTLLGHWQGCCQC